MAHLSQLFGQRRSHKAGAAGYEEFHTTIPFCLNGFTEPETQKMLENLKEAWQILPYVLVYIIYIIRLNVRRCLLPEFQPGFFIP